MVLRVPTFLYLFLMESRESLRNVRSDFLTFTMTLGSFNLSIACKIDTIL